MKERADCKSTKPKVSAKKDIVEVFWKKYIKSDSLQRKEMLKKMIQVFIEGAKIEDNKIREQTITNSLQNYFDDLIMVMNKNGKE